MSDETRKLPVIKTAVDPLEAAVAEYVGDAAHPTRVAYERARADHPGGGEEARAAFHRYLAEEKIKRDAGVDRRGPKAPSIDEKTGVPFCSQTACPKYAKFQGRCTETDSEDPTICEPAVRDMVLELDARKDAADPAFDEIVAMCGLAKTWEYPGQVIRDVRDALKKRDDKIAELRHALVVCEDDRSALVEQNGKLQACIKYARDRRGSSFDFDEWKTQVEHALDNKIPPHAIENAQAKEAQAWAAVSAIRKERDELREWLGTWGRSPDQVQKRFDELKTERDADLHVMTRQGKVIDDLRAQLDAIKGALRVAEAVRDDARAASQRYLDEKRAVEAAGAELTALVAKLMPEAQGRPLEPGQCRWILPDGDPDEGWWYCKHPEGHDGVHETEFGRGRDERWHYQAPGAPTCEKCGRNDMQHHCGTCGQWDCDCDGHFKEDVVELERERAARSAPKYEGIFKAPETAREVADAVGTGDRHRQHDAPQGGPTLGGEDMSPVPSIRAAQIDAVINGDPQPDVPAWAMPGLSSVQVRDAIIREVGMMASARTPDMQIAYDLAVEREKKAGTRQLTPTRACGCSPKYLELAPGTHAKYCALAGLPLDDDRKRWHCASCNLTYRSPASAPTQQVAACQKCGGPTTEKI